MERLGVLVFVDVISVVFEGSEAVFAGLLDREEPFLIRLIFKLGFEITIFKRSKTISGINSHKSGEGS